MVSRISRLLLAAAAAIFAFGGAMHAAAYAAKARPGIDASNLPAFLGAELKVLWLADSTTLVALALVIGFIAAKPASVAKAVIMLLAIIPAATAVLLYFFLGPFYPGHLLLVASVMVFVAGLVMPARDSGSEPVGAARNSAARASR
jgi:peptidoglycan/LPS O-acetylase OafA/YrhL